MTREEIIRLAETAGFEVERLSPVLGSEVVEIWLAAMTNFANLVAAAEREECVGIDGDRIHSGEYMPKLVELSILDKPTKLGISVAVVRAPDHALGMICGKASGLPPSARGWDGPPRVSCSAQGGRDDFNNKRNVRKNERHAA